MKEVITGKRKRVRKPKSAVQEAESADEPEPEQEVAQTMDAPKPWRAPVARMYQSVDRGELGRWKKNRIQGGFLKAEECVSYTTTTMASTA